MKSKDKIQLLLTFDNTELKSAMSFFFKTYQEQLPLFLSDQLAKLEINADPTMGIGPDEIKFKSYNKDKGSVLVQSEDGVRFSDYKLVPVDTAYCLYEIGKLVVFYKRGKFTADTRVGEFPDFNMITKALAQIVDPLVTLAEAEKLAEEAKAELDVENGMAEAEPQEQLTEGPEAEMKVTKK